MRAFVALSLILTSCLHSGDPVRGLTEDYETIKGVLVAPPVPENGKDRLFIYLEKKSVLGNLANKLNNAPDATVFVYARKVDGPWYEYVEGIDYVAVAVGVYVPYSNRYALILTDYGESLTDALRSLKWGAFIGTLGRAAVKQAF
jgi:hypothetical protein